jgi:hypothetical protein
MRIVNPSFGLQPDAGQSENRVDLGATDWLKDPIAIISNSKPNAMELLQGMRTLMGQFRPVDTIDYMFKDSAAQPAPPELIERVAKNYRGAIVALAD